MDLAHTSYEPAGEGPHPTIVALHGWGASAFDLIGLAPYLARGRFQILCPQGKLTVPIGPTHGYGWFPLSGGGLTTDQGSLDEAAGAVRRFLESARRRYAIDARKLVLLGFSQGGVVAYLVALGDPGAFAGLAALSSWLPPPLVARLPAAEERRTLATLVQHGSSDEVIAVARGRQSVESLRELRVPVTYREYAMGHEIGPASLADLSTWLEEKILSPVIHL